MSVPARLQKPVVVEARGRGHRRRALRWGFALAIAVGLLAAPAWKFTQFDPFGRAARAFEARQYQTAMGAAQSHLRWFPGDRAAALMTANCLMRLGRAAEAEPYFQKAEPLALADAQVRAYNLVNLNDPQAAVTAYEAMLERWPTDVLALKRLAAVRMGLKQWTEALKLAERLKAIPDAEVAGLTIAAIANHERKHYAEAATAGVRVLELDPELRQMPLPRPLFWNNLCVDLIAGGRTDEARAYLTRALAVTEDAGLMELLGLTHSQQGSIDEAERCWRLAESWDPENADVCLDLGRLAMKRSQWKEAIVYFERAARKATDAVEPLYNLSQAYRMLGNRAESDRYRRLADIRRSANPPPAGGMGGATEPDPHIRGLGHAPSPEAKR
jgi:tetratricopeptide (TPR) repeat protein